MLHCLRRLLLYRVNTPAGCWLLLGLLLAELPVVAQTSLSLAETLRLGGIHNTDLQLAIQREAIAQSNQRIGVPDRLPSVVLGVSQNNYLNQYNSPTNFVRGIYQDNSLNGGISGSLLLYNGGRLGLSQIQLNQLALRAALETQAVRQQVNRLLVEAYYRVVVEGAKLGVRSESVALSKARWVDFKAQERLGKASTFDVLQAENLFLIDSTSYFQQDIEYQIAQNRLHTAIGWNRFEPIVLTDSLTPTLHPAIFFNLSGKLISLNFDLRSRRIGVMVAENTIRLQKTAFKPTVRLNSSIYQSFTGTKFPDIPRINGNATSLLLAGFSLSVPLLPGREARRAVRQSELERGLSEITVRGAERRLLAEADLLERSYQEQSRIVALSERLINNAARSLTIAHNRLLGGFSNLIEYRSVQLAYTEAKLNHLQALYALKLIESTARQLIGTLK
ncbi:TolC family protein [Spirosoma taeanense]|uniref:TolC family protein n=1 Tax=Spirosoma taeanense TaxID=2735870 RepID=A0A6M5Y790_9BACT|nr:TolC family protein [Spirosoma taeanense]QJW89354.1 TolC family protein [Spirosoma taeanense]